MIEIKTVTLEGQARPYRVDRYPDACPLCHTSLHPKLLAAVADGFDVVSWLQLAFQCTKHTCKSVFVAKYHPVGQGTFGLVSTAPTTAKKQEFSDEIESVSPTFVEIFNQCLAAEAAQLHQLSGIGLRKGLEFLIKDFAVNQKPTDRETILRTPLGDCIDRFVDDPNIQQCAKRAAWLGNDETHYLRKWEDRDGETLYKLIGKEMPKAKEAAPMPAEVSAGTVSAAGSIASS